MRAVDREAAWLKGIQRLGEFVESLGADPGQGVPEGTRLVGFNVKLATAEQPEVLIILKASGESGAYVAFAGGLTLPQALLGWRARHLADGVKWREDVPWSQR